MQRHTLEHDGIEREYFVFLPSGYNGSDKFPLAMLMHGYGGSATGVESEVSNGLNHYAERYGFIMVYPQSSWFMAGSDGGRKWEATSWNHISDAFDEGPSGPICTEDAVNYPCPPECGSCDRCGWASCNDDVGFLRKVLKEVTDTYSVDSDRRFTAGFSNGAMMANRFACEASDMLAGVALLGGRVEPGFECAPTTDLPLLQINGRDDVSVPIDGRESSEGYFYASEADIEYFWLNERQCQADSRQPWSADILRDEQAACTIACADTASPSISCSWPGGHFWPGLPVARGSNGYCVSELQSASMPDRTLCIKPDPTQENWGSNLLFQFFQLSAK